MCFPFFAAQGHDVGSSKCEDEGVEPARRALESDKLELPTDLVAGREVSADTEGRGLDGVDGAAESSARAGVRDVDGVDVPDGWMGLDIGRSSAEAYASVIAEAGTVFWN